MLRDLESVKDNVAQILDKYPETRNDDKLLWIAYMVFFCKLQDVLGQEGYQKFKALMLSKNTPMPESIRRVRQKYQEDGLYTARPQVAAARMEQQELVRGWARD